MLPTYTLIFLILVFIFNGAMFCIWSNKDAYNIVFKAFFGFTSLFAAAIFVKDFM